jgi:hypothetical protein
MDTTFSAENNPPKIGEISIIRGDATRIASLTKERFDLKDSDEIFEKDIVQTSKKGVARLLLNDGSTVLIAPDSSFYIKEHKVSSESRNMSYKLLKGKIRAHVIQKVGIQNAIKFKSSAASIGVRGTTFLFNAYSVNKAATSDILLLKGKLDTVVKKSGSLPLNAGEGFNTNALQEQGLSSLQKISQSDIDNLLGSDNFLPNLQNADGSYLNLKDKLKEMFDSGADLKIPEVKPVVMGSPKVHPIVPVTMEEKSPSMKASQSSQSLKHFKYNLAQEPWDIRDAVINMKKNHAQNECYYYFYKTLPGGGDDERFRRSRACDEVKYED